MTADLIARLQGPNYTDAVDEAVVEIVTLRQQLAAAEGERDALKQRAVWLAGLLDDLRDYNPDHLWHCASTHVNGKPCDCGLALLLQQVNAALAAPDGAAGGA